MKNKHLGELMLTRQIVTANRRVCSSYTYIYISKIYLYTKQRKKEKKQNPKKQTKKTKSVLLKLEKKKDELLFIFEF